jgi:hypothetical protein
MKMKMDFDFDRTLSWGWAVLQGAEAIPRGLRGRN